MDTTIQTFEGSIGIGTQNPQKQLHVEGGLLTTSNMQITGNLTVSGNTVVLHSNNVTIEDKLFGIGSGDVDHDMDMGILMEHEGANVALIYHSDEKRFSMGFTQNTLTDDHILNFQEMEIDILGNAVVQNNFSIIHGNVAVGTTPSAFKLDVHGTANVGTLTTTKLITDGTLHVGTSNLVVTSNVGIGTDTPDFDLDVRGTANVGTMIATSVSGDGGLLTGLTSTLQEAADSGNVTSNTVQFSNAITSLVVSSNIVVGGNVTATSLLGDGSGLTGISSGGFTVNSGNAVRTTGNVGIGTNVPLQKLDVHGNVNTTGNLYFSNTLSSEYSTVSAGVWSQVGGDIDGEAAGDYSGRSVALSSDGTRLAVGAYENDGTGSYAGHVRVFDLGGGAWTQVGGDIDGEAAGDRFGSSVALSSDGSRLAVGGPFNDGNGSSAGHVRVFDNLQYTKQTIKDYTFEVGTANLYVDTTTGNVGVGTATPHAKLHVHGDAGLIQAAQRRYFRYDQALTSDSASTSDPSIYATDQIVSGNYFISSQGTISSSDYRIKRDIIDIDDASALETLRLLKPKKYTYKDLVSKGEEPVWGFIAQEVRDTLPYATKIGSDYIPNIYELTNVSQNVITFSEFNTSNLESNATILQAMDESDQTRDLTLVKIIDDKTIEIKENLESNQIFIFGQKVNDFVYLDKNAIFTVATAALQEVDRQLQHDEVENDSISSRLTKLEEMF